VSRPTDQPSPGSGLPEGVAAPSRLALVIDDEPSIRLALRRFLVREGWQVDEADDGTIALDKLIPSSGEPPHYDLIICDLRMPGCGGVELHERLRTSNPEMLRRFIVATGNAVSEDTAEFVRQTLCPVLQKPFELSELRALLRRITTT
jgi:CheY-like chemotaxis protein